ncbi:MAG: hypothetical protein IPJ69_12855 [Deltaproteobacteria bacterium]|nr:MAG: hypothetical protein IPJ69_12855 [Deltaproteobacteria bacterium]
MADGGFSSNRLPTFVAPTPLVVAATSRVLTEALDFYYERAAHRQLPPDHYVAPQIVSQSSGDILFIRGMLHFEPSNPYLNTFRAQGFDVRVHRYSKEVEANKLRQWPENAVDLLIRILENPYFLKPQQILIGHSAGGNQLIPLKAMALGVDPGKIIEVLPKNDTLWNLILDDKRVERASRQLADSLFIAEGAPLMGVELTLPGRIAKRHAIERLIPGLLSALTVRNMANVYNKLSLDPKKAVDGVIYSETAPLDLSTNQNPLSLAAHGATQAIYRAFTPFLKIEKAERHDGIVPADSARVGWSELERDLRELKVHFDHLGLVEFAAAAASTLQLISQLRGAESVYN